MIAFESDPSDAAISARSNHLRLRFDYLHAFAWRGKERKENIEDFTLLSMNSALRYASSITDEDQVDDDDDDVGPEQRRRRWRRWRKRMALSYMLQK